MHILVLCLAWIFCTVSAVPTIRSSSKCSVHPCNQFSFVNCVSDERICFHFQTNNGTSFCAPASSCELLDPCDHNGYCLSNRSVCIVNSCCAQPVCLPLILIDLCSSNNLTEETMNVYTRATSRLSTTSARTPTESETSSVIIKTEFTTDSFTTENPLELITTTTTTTEVQSSTELKYENRRMKDFEISSPTYNPRICSKASWNNTGIIAASFSDVMPEDFFINQYDEIYVPDAKNHLIRKYFPGNHSIWITAVESNLLHDPTAIFVDRNDNIYIWDSATYRVYFWSSMNRNGRTILSFDGCKDSANFNETCFGKSLFVDSNNSIYISESTPRYLHANRVMKFEVNSTIGHVIAGTSIYGSGMKQLHSPGTIFVDSKGILYVADIDNSRIQKFMPGNRSGTTVISMEDLTDFIMDQDGQFYVTIKSEKVIRRIKKKSKIDTKENIIEFLHQPTRIHFGIDGSIYVLHKDNGTIEKFQIMNNIC